MPTCKTCDSTFEPTAEDLAYYDRINVPTPNDCPRCRLIRRLAERNSKTLYMRKCDFSGVNMVSQYDPSVPFPVYKKEHWWSDKWDPLSYGRDFDFSRPFFEQYYELWLEVPRMALFIGGDTLENSDFVNCASYVKNCYLIGEADYDEDCYYSNRVFHCKNIVDCSTAYDSEECYECLDVRGCQRLFYSEECKNCSDSYFLSNCQSCRDCIGCINQRQKQYMIFNEQYSKEEYENRKADLHLDTAEGIKKLGKMADDFFKTRFFRDVIEEQNQNCSGDHLYNSKNSFECFDCTDLEDCKYCARLFGGAKDCMDYTSWCDKAELIYNCISCGDNVYNLKFCANCMMSCSNLEYCQHCVSSQDCFGSVGLNRKKFCIFNKEYSENEYHELKAKIIEHMRKTGEYGNFFPKKFASHGYNASLAQDEFPLTKNEALEQGFHWVDEVQDAQMEHLACKSCQKPYKFISQELAFYKNYKIPEPENCQLCRHRARQKKRRPIELWERQCDKCQKNIQSSIPTDRPEKVYCKKCYLEEIY